MLTRHPGGRPITLTPALIDDLADAVEHGVPLDTAARSRGFSDRTLDDWLSVGRGDTSTWRSGQDVDDASLALCQALARSVAVARAKREETLALSLGAMAEHATREDSVRLKAVTSILQLHPSYRDRWGQHVTVQQTGTVNHQHLHVELSPAEARAMGDRLRSREMEAPHPSNGSGGVEDR